MITEAFRLLEEPDQHYQEWLDETRVKIDEGIASLERGEGIDGETFVSQLLAEFKQAKENH